MGLGRIQVLHLCKNAMEYLVEKWNLHLCIKPILPYFSKPYILTYK